MKIENMNYYLTKNFQIYGGYILTFKNEPSTREQCSSLAVLLHLQSYKFKDSFSAYLIHGFISTSAEIRQVQLGHEAGFQNLSADSTSA